MTTMGHLICISDTENVRAPKLVSRNFFLAEAVSFFADLGHAISFPCPL
jgi:hypothetical protein